MNLYTAGVAWECVAISSLVSAALVIGQPTAVNHRVSVRSNPIIHTEIPAQPRAIDPSTIDVDKLARNARIVPVVSDGKSIGFKLSALRPGSTLANLGFRNGDIIISINGIDLTIPETALGMYTQLTKARSWNVLVRRAGVDVRLTYAMRNL